MKLSTPLIDLQQLSTGRRPNPELGALNPRTFDWKQTSCTVTGFHPHHIRRWTLGASLPMRSYAALVGLESYLALITLSYQHGKRGQFASVRPSGHFVCNSNVCVLGSWGGI